MLFWENKEWVSSMSASGAGGKLGDLSNKYTNQLMKKSSFGSSVHVHIFIKNSLKNVCSSDHHMYLVRFVVWTSDCCYSGMTTENK